MNKNDHVITKTVNLTMYKSVYLWFEPLHSFHKDVINANLDDDILKGEFPVSYDYVLFPADKKRFFLDIGLNLRPIGRIMTRSCFKFKYRYDWYDFMVPDVIEPMVEMAYNEAIKGFLERCQFHGIKIDFELAIPPDAVKESSESIIDDYITNRQESDIANKYMNEHYFIKFTPGTKTSLIVNGTIMIVDALLFNFDDFQTKNNQMHFQKVMSLTCYYSLKLDCFKINHHPVDLTIYYSTMFLLCLDLALQMMMGDLEPKLLEVLKNQGMTPELRDEYIEYSAQFYEKSLKKLADSHTTITNLEERYDWNSLMK